MPKRRKLLNSPRKSPRINNTKAPRDEIEESPKMDREVRIARGRFMGALLEALEADSDDERHTPHKKREKEVSDDEDSNQKHLAQQRQTYVLKLFDRSVDLSQFKEDTPLYPICRAWIKNQPKANYHVMTKHKESLNTEELVELPPPQGPPVSRIPPLLPEQAASSKNNINLDYHESEAPPLEQLINGHRDRWVAVRRAWLARAAAVERRYDATQQALNAMNNL